MTKKILTIIFSLSVALLLAACQLNVGGNTAAGGSQTTAMPTVIKATNTPRPSVTPRPTITSLPTTSPFADVQAAASAYGDALLKGDFASAAGMISSYSLMVANLTKGDIEAQMKAAGDQARIANVKFLSVREAGSATVLLHVSYLSGKDGAARDETWPFRDENGVWKYNWGNLVDFHTLTVDPQTTNGITLVPLRLLRYSDHTRLELMGQNHTNEPVIMGQPNEVLATFQIGGNTVEAEKTHLALDALRTNNSLALDIPGYYDVYPASVDIRKWRDFNEKPWFSFVLP